jgi:hypothetical protein
VQPVAFAGVIPSTHACNAGYFSRVGVLRKHCGRCLQLRLMRAMESRARNNGWSCVVSDTTDNVASANNFHPRRLSPLSTATSLGMAQYAVLAKVHRVIGQLSI